MKALVVLAAKWTRAKGTRKSRLMPICFVHLDCIIAVQHRWRIGRRQRRMSYRSRSVLSMTPIDIDIDLERYQVFLVSNAIH